MARCEAFGLGDSVLGAGRRLRCQQDAGHKGQCSYHRRGGQGGSLTVWWGANPRPSWWIGDFSYAALGREIWRLRGLCDEHDVDWQSGLPTAEEVR